MYANSLLCLAFIFSNIWAVHGTCGWDLVTKDEDSNASLTVCGLLWCCLAVTSIGRMHTTSTWYSNISSSQVKERTCYVILLPLSKRSVQITPVWYTAWLVVDASNLWNNSGMEFLHQPKQGREEPPPGELGGRSVSCSCGGEYKLW
jgi:hypothetical protein